MSDGWTFGVGHGDRRVFLLIRNARVIRVNSMIFQLVFIMREHLLQTGCFYSTYDSS